MNQNRNQKPKSRALSDNHGGSKNNRRKQRVTGQQAFGTERAMRSGFGGYMFVLFDGEV